jgi:glycosyltransferase involved in cell wall biosynthesis
MDWKRTLIVNDFPPSTLAGAPVILRQCFLGIPAEHLSVLCCRTFYSSADVTVRATYLPCKHEAVPGIQRGAIRPSRWGVPLAANINTLRIPDITRRGIRICQEQGINAIVTGTVNMEFTIAAWRIASQLGLPLYIWEPDDWFSANPAPAVKLLGRERMASLKGAAHIWTVSEPMAKRFRDRYGLESEPLHHVLDIDRCKDLAASVSPPNDKIRIVYTGSINEMFRETLVWFADIINRGLTIDGRTVELVIWTPHKPSAFMGPNVHWGGFVPVEQIPLKLGESHIAAVLVSFTDRPDIRSLIETSIYTKTVDYLASGTPTLIIAPEYAAQVDAFGPASMVLTQLDEAALVNAIRSMALDESERSRLQDAGFALVREKHSMAAREQIFLSKFRL